MKIVDWNIEAMTGYKPQTTFYTDFSIADNFGLSAIEDTYHRCIREDGWGSNVVYLTELVMALNWKIWEHYNHNDEYAKLYQELYEKTDRYARDHLMGDDLMYYYRTTD